MSVLRTGSWSSGIALAGIVACLLACKHRDVRAVVTQQRNAGDHPVALRRTFSDAQSSPASQAKVRIVLSESRGTERQSLAFCYDDGSAYDPQIRGVRIAQVNGDKKIYEVAAIGSAFLWRDWVIGTVPRGFKLVGGDRLTAGTYEIYVDAVVGEGALRISVDDQGTIKSLPWDQFDTSYGRRCEPSDRTEPRVIPKQDLGKDDLLEAHRKKESRSQQHPGQK